MSKNTEDAEVLERWVTNTATLHELGMKLGRMETPPDALHWRELAKEAARQFELAENRTRDRVSDRAIEIAAPMLQEVFAEKVKEEDSHRFREAKNGEV